MKKYFAISLATCIALSPMVTSAVDSPDSNAIMPISAPISDEIEFIEEVQLPDYIEYKGKIVEVNKNDNSFSILVKDNEEDPYNGMLFHINNKAILLSDETKDFITKDKFEKGMTVTGYYHKETVMLMSIPAQLEPDVIVLNTSEKPSNINISTFDEELVNSFGDLKLNISDDTVIVDKEGNKVDKEEIKNRDLVVFYGATTRSIPAQTTPEKIVVLENREKQYVINEPEIKILDKIYINDKEIKLEKEIFEDVNGTKMIPLRQIAEDLGYKVTWDNDLKRAELVKGPHWTAITIGEDNYNFAKMAIKLGATPILIDSTTYVPFDFLKEVLRVEVNITTDGAINVLE